MEEIYCLEELVAIVKGFARYLDKNQYDKMRFLCHPMYENKVFCVRTPEVTWMNEGPNLPVLFSFLGSTDGETWGPCDLENMIECVENLEDYFIADLGCRHYMSLECHNLEETVEFLSREMPVIFLDTDAWEEGELGELITISMRDAVRAINF